MKSHGTLLVLLICVSQVSLANRIQPAKLFAPYGTQYVEISGSWGITSRLNGEYYQQIALTRSYYRTTCTQRSFTGYGINAVFFGDNNYAFGVKYYRVSRPWTGHMLNTYIGISPSWFTIEGASGFNVKPLFGFEFCPLYGNAVALDLDVFYGYEIPVLHARDFTPGRHDLSAMLSLTINIDRTVYLLNRSQAEKDLSR